MATFIFRLTPDSQQSEILRVHDQLHDRFPQHRFLLGDDDSLAGQFDIALAEPCASHQRPSQADPDELNRVRHAFFSMLDHWG